MGLFSKPANLNEVERLRHLLAKVDEASALAIKISGEEGKILRSLYIDADYLNEFCKTLSGIRGFEGMLMNSVKTEGELRSLYRALYKLHSRDAIDVTELESIKKSLEIAKTKVLSQKEADKIEPIVESLHQKLAITENDRRALKQYKAILENAITHLQNIIYAIKYLKQFPIGQQRMRIPTSPSATYVEGAFHSARAVFEGKEFTLEEYKRHSETALATIIRNLQLCDGIIKRILGQEKLKEYLERGT